MTVNQYNSARVSRWNTFGTNRSFSSSSLFPNSFRQLLIGSSDKQQHDKWHVDEQNKVNHETHVQEVN